MNVDSQIVMNKARILAKQLDYKFSLESCMLQILGDNNMWYGVSLYCGNEIYMYDMIANGNKEAYDMAVKLHKKKSRPSFDLVGIPITINY